MIKNLKILQEWNQFRNKVLAIAGQRTIKIQLQ